jgi:hypothetical protein
MAKSGSVPEPEWAGGDALRGHIDNSDEFAGFGRKRTVWPFANGNTATANKQGSMVGNPPAAYGKRKKSS